MELVSSWRGENNGRRHKGKLLGAVDGGGA